MTEHEEGQPKESTIRSLSGTDEDATEEQKERMTKSPEQGSAGQTSPEDPAGSPAEATSKIGDQDQREGQTGHRDD